MPVECQTRFSVCKEIWKTNGHSLVLDLKRSGSVKVKTVHKEHETKMAERMLQKVDAQFSVLQVHCPEVESEAKDMETVDTLCSRFGND